MHYWYPGMQTQIVFTLHGRSRFLFCWITVIKFWGKQFSLLCRLQVICSKTPQWYNVSVLSFCQWLNGFQHPRQIAPQNLCRLSACVMHWVSYLWPTTRNRNLPSLDAEPCNPWFLDASIPGDILFQLHPQQKAKPCRQTMNSLADVLSPSSDVWFCDSATWLCKAAMLNSRHTFS